MSLPSIPDIEEALLTFRVGRRLVLDELLGRIARQEGLTNPFLMLSRLFGRLRSADSVLEKIRRKSIEVNDVCEVPQKIRDILGFRVITQDMQELDTMRRFLTDRFEIVSVSDFIAEPSEFGYRGIEYSLQHHVAGEVYPFEVQLRTLLQHYWAARSFHLFHKTSREKALSYSGALLSLSDTLEEAEQAAERLVEPILPSSQPEISWSDLPLRKRVNLVVVEPGERFAVQVIQELTGRDRDDHEAIVMSKLDLYRAYPNSAIVECSCLHFLSFALNEPQVRVPLDRIGKVRW